MDKRYFIVIKNEQKGPYSINELKKIGLKEDTLIWFEGLSGWTKLGKIKQLREIIETFPPTIPEIESKKKDVFLNTNLRFGKRTKTEGEKIDSKLKTEKLNIFIVKELKIIFKLLLIAIVIGVLSYPVIVGFKRGFHAIILENKYEDILNKYNNSWSYNNSKYEIWRSKKEKIEQSVVEFFFWHKDKNTINNMGYFISFSKTPRYLSRDSFDFTQTRKFLKFANDFAFSKRTFNSAFNMIWKSILILIFGRYLYIYGNRLLSWFKHYNTTSS